MKLSSDIVKKIRHIEIHTKRLLKSTQSGAYRSRQKGFGLEFDQIRDYENGDDVRYIDWKSSARLNKLLVKQYIHEYNKTVLLCVDISASTLVGSQATLKNETLTTIATILTLAAEYGRAQVGLLFFSDEIELFIPPKLGKKNVQTVIQKLWSIKPRKKKTNIKNMLSRLASLKRQDTIAVVLSDFIDTAYERDLRLVNHRYDLMAVRCLDSSEKEFPFKGLLHIQDPETGKTLLLDSASNDYLSASFFLNQRLSRQNAEFKKSGIDYLDVDPKKDFIHDLVLFFARRLRD